jgi:hypothetical protein
MRRELNLAILLPLLLWRSATLAEDAPNEVLQFLVTQGVPVGDQQRVPLPKPSMADDLDMAQQQAVLEGVADARRPVSRLTRRSIVSPFVLKLGKQRIEGSEDPARTIDLWFVAHGELDLLRDKSFLEQLAGVVEKPGENQIEGRAALLEDVDLKPLSITDVGENERYFFSQFGLFDRVEISATRHATITHNEESLTFAARLDPRFRIGSEYPSQWRSVTRDDLGQLVFGPPQTYTSAGFYLKVTRLVDQEDALFVEYHQAFVEPEGWFHGANLLRSKLPLLVQDGVRKFRRKLASATKEADAAPLIESPSDGSGEDRPE